MVSTHKSSSNNHSPTTAPSSGPSVDDINTPNFKPKTLPSPWAQVVRGGETESPTSIHQSLPSSTSSSSSSLTTGMVDQTPSCDYSSTTDSTPPPPVNSSTIASIVDSSDGSDCNAGRSTKPAWNKPSNGIVETGPVMGADSWPALSEATKFSGKLPAESSPKIAAADGSPSTSQGPVISHSSQRQGTSNTKYSSATNYNVPNNRPKPHKGVGGSNIIIGPAQSSLSNPPTPPPLPPFPVYHLPPVNYHKMAPRMLAPPSPRDHHWNNNWDARPLVRGSSRRSNSGSHPRVDGSYHHNNYRNRRDQGRGNHVNARDAHIPQPGILPPSPRGILTRHLSSNAPFLGPQPLGPFPNPAVYPELYFFPPTVMLEPPRNMPFFPHSPSPAPYIPAAESPLSNAIVKQIDYYFSDANLAQDEFLKSNMDEEGWVPVTLIASFRRMRSLTSNIQLILDSMKTSIVVDVQGDKLRRRNEWMKWLPSSQVQTDSGSVSPRESRYNNLTAEFQTINLEKTTINESEPFRQSQLSNGSDVAGNTN